MKHNNLKANADYPNLSKRNDNDRYSHPAIQYLCDRLRNATVFSTIHLKNSLFSVTHAKVSHLYIAFVTYYDQFHFQSTDFLFQDEQYQAFHKLKLALSFKPVFNIYNQNSDTEIHLDDIIHGYDECIFYQKSLHLRYVKKHL